MTKILDQTDNGQWEEAKTFSESEGTNSIIPKNIPATSPMKVETSASGDASLQKEIKLIKSASFPMKINRNALVGHSGEYSWNTLPTSPFSSLVHAFYTDQRLKLEIAYGKRMGFYHMKGDIGTGNFSKVKVAMHTLTKERVAVKILDKSKMDERTKRLLSGEISNMEKLHHPNIIRLFEVMHSKSKLFLVMEYAGGGELFSRLTSQGKMAENEAKTVFSQILSAIDHMHRHKIIHRDLKAENVFFAEKRIVKVGDFGFSIKAHGSIDQLDTFCGSPPYAAPELFRDSYYYGEYVDIWALGILLYFTVTGTMPFRAETVGKLKRKILLGHYTVPSHVSLDFKHLIQSILRLDPKQRISLHDIAQSSWLTGVSLPSRNSFLNLNPASIVRKEAHPEEAYALYMLNKLGINEEELSNVAMTDSGLHVSKDMERERRNTDENDFKVNLDQNNAIIGTYRILLNRAHLKLTECTKEDLLKFSAITNLITGRDVAVSNQDTRLCSFCKTLSVVSLKSKEPGSDKALSRNTASDSNLIPKRKKAVPRSNVKSKFCVIL